MEVWETIRLRCRQDGEKIKVVARNLGLVSNTVRKYLRRDDPPKKALLMRPKILEFAAPVKGNEKGGLEGLHGFIEGLAFPKVCNFSHGGSSSDMSILLCIAAATLFAAFTVAPALAVEQGVRLTVPDDTVVSFQLVTTVASEDNSVGDVVHPTPGRASISITSIMKKADAAFDNFNFADAMRWYRKAADQNNDTAETKIGDLYVQGHGVTKNYAEAMRWYRKAADQNNAVAQASIGTLYEGGYGVTKNYGEAVRWYRMAANQNQPEAQYLLGACYADADGRGVPRDMAQARFWMRKAAANGIEEATQWLDNHNSFLKDVQPLTNSPDDSRAYR